MIALRLEKVFTIFEYNLDYAHMSLTYWEDQKSVIFRIFEAVGAFLHVFIRRRHNATTYYQML